ncbi:MAG: type IV pilus secretin PilQ family protein [Gammaproteobacteria bacterium]|nr:type IV pilus secretin PilQ family protein [Gammaproteobacteria bacterium]
MAFTKKLMTSLMLTVLSIPMLAQAVELVDVRYSDMVENQLKLEFIFDSKITKPQSHIVAKPTQLVLDFIGASSSLALNNLPINGSGVKSLSLKSTANALSIAINLNHLVEYQQLVHDNMYVVIIGDKANIVPIEQNIKIKKSDIAKAKIETIRATSLNQVKSIDFRLNSRKDGELKIEFDNSSLVADVTQNGRKLIIKLLGSDIAEGDLYTMDVMDFSTPVSRFETFREKNGVRIVVEMSKAFQFEHRQEGNEFILTVKSPKKGTKRVAHKKKVVYSGKRMSLNFQKVEIRTALQIIADYNDFNLVTGDNVSGDITLRIEDTPWDQILDIVLKLKGLDKRIDGNILLVAPAKELIEREAADLQANKNVEELAPLYSEFLQINYAKARVIAGLLDSGKSRLLSQRGSVAVDERTNILLIQDTAKKLDDVRRLVEVLDVPVRQVVIEARIVTVTDNVNEEFGIRWGVTDTVTNGALSGNLTGANTARQGSIPALDDRLNVNLPVSSPAGTIAFQVAKLADGTLLDLELSALERENKGEVIARPSITTSNQKAAYIEQGTEIPYVSAASSGATTVTFKQAVLALRVTPHITPDDRIILDLVITQDTRGDTVKTATGEAVAINKQEIGTQVLVDNGETIVLGGIYQQELSKVVSKVPVLGDVPLLGWLFRTQKDVTERRELLIFVTPRIVVERNKRN